MVQHYCQGMAPARQTGVSNGEGSGALAPNPSFWSIKTRFLDANRKSTSLENALEHQPACKPGFVGHRGLAPTIRDGHSSGTMFAHCLEQPTRTASLTMPYGIIALRLIFPRCRPYSVLLPVWFAMPVPLPDPRCALTAPFHPYCPPPFIPPPQAGEGRVGEAVRSLWHCPWGRPRRTLSGTVCRWSPDFPPQPPFGDCRSGRPAD